MSGEFSFSLFFVVSSIALGTWNCSASLAIQDEIWPFHLRLPINHVQRIRLGKRVVSNLNLMRIGMIGWYQSLCLSNPMFKLTFYFSCCDLWWQTLIARYVSWLWFLWLIFYQPAYKIGRKLPVGLLNDSVNFGHSVGPGTAKATNCTANTNKNK